MASILDNNKPRSLAEETASYKNLGEKELLAIIAENARREKGYVQAISILILLDLCIQFALVIGIFMGLNK